MLETYDEIILPAERGHSQEWPCYLPKKKMPQHVYAAVDDCARQ